LAAQDQTALGSHEPTDSARSLPPIIDSQIIILSESQQPIPQSCKMLSQIFRNACEEYGTYCPNKNELRILKHRKAYRFTCGESELRFVAPGREQIVILVAPDVTTYEFKRCFTYLIDSH
jgi:hypothetical protein